MIKLYKMKNLQAIIKKYSEIEHNQDNYEIGGGLSNEKFASRRHEDAKNDIGKLTLGKAVQMFKKATGIENLEIIKEVLHYAVPNMEWHHAGKLPKQYGGGMKKTYFLNASEIVKIASEWNQFFEKVEISKTEQRNAEEQKKSRDEVKREFLNINAKRVTRVTEKPKYFYETDREMNGKYGWFSSYGKSYNMTEYFSGWEFDTEEILNQFINL